ncbi:MAG: LPXTG cell wall anchor domain-containing protein [Chloroflexota bacterium]
MWFNYAHKLLMGIIVVTILYSILPVYTTHTSFAATLANGTNAQTMERSQNTLAPRSTSVPSTPLPKPTESSEPTTIPTTPDPEPTDAPNPTGIPEPTDVPNPTGIPEPTDVPNPTGIPEPTNDPITPDPEPTDMPAPSATAITPTDVPTLAPSAEPTTTPEATSERSTSTPNIPPTPTADQVPQTPTAPATTLPTATNETTPTLAPTETHTPPPTPEVCVESAKDDISAHIVGRGKVRIKNRSTECSYPVGIAVYTIPSGDPHDPDIDSQIWFADSEQNGVPYELGPAINASQPNEQVLEIPTPLCDAIQLDAFVGNALKSLNGQRYGARLLTAGRYAPAKTDCNELTGQVIFDQDSRMTCMTHADYIVIEGAVVLQPTEKQAQLQLSWHTQMPETQQSELQSELIKVQDGDDFEISIPWPGIPQEPEVEMVNVHVEGVLLNESNEQITESYASSGIYWYDWLECQAPQLPASPTPTLPPSTATPVPSATMVRSTATPVPTSEVVSPTTTPEPTAVATAPSEAPQASRPRQAVTPVPTATPTNSIPYNVVTIPEKTTPDVPATDVPIEQLSIEPSTTIAYESDTIPASLPNTGTANNTLLLILFSGGVLVLFSGVWLRWQYRKTKAKHKT